MGYETTMLITEKFEATKKAKLTGYMSIMATVELNKVCYDAMGLLIEGRRKSDKESRKIYDKVGQIKQIEDAMYDSEGYYTETFKALSAKKQVALNEKRCKQQKELQTNYPYVYYTDGNKEDYLDSHGDSIIICRVEEVIEAMKKDQAKFLLEHGREYEPFTVGLAVLECYKDREHTHVVLFGH